ncbi:MAG TPA: TatD family hydrolase [Gemmatimonadales bacterium]|nr:TatD family hydrolase [Gemmatimonadales bacterium]
MLVDTHCHLGDTAYAADRAEVAARAWAAGVGHIVVVGESPASADGALALADDPRFSATAGVHPHIASEWTSDTASWLSERLADSRVVAAGEMGLDYHYEHSPRAVQQRVFDVQLSLAGAAGKPAVIHAREADDDVAALLRAHPRTACILHSFSSGMGLLRAGVALGHYISFSGMITFRSWQLDDAIRETPRDRLLIETDGPYLAPVPHRGKRNEPSFVGRVAARLAEVIGVSGDEAAALTAANARRVFGDRVAASAA